METTLERMELQTSWPAEPALPPPPPRSKLWFLGLLPIMLLLAFSGALVAKTYMFQAFFIPSASMEPTLVGKDPGGDRVIVNKLVYEFRSPMRGEVIVFVARPDLTPRSTFEKIRSFLTDWIGLTRSKETDYIKRVIGLPGETIEVTDTDVWITPVGKPRRALVEPYIKLETQNLYLLEPTVVPDGHVFVMGDNRNNSQDSRSNLGPVPIERIIGKAFVIVWPLGRIGAIDTPHYPRPGSHLGSQVDGAAPSESAAGSSMIVAPVLLIASKLQRRRLKKAA